MGGDIPRRLTKKQQQAIAAKDVTITDCSKGVYGKKATYPIFGNYFRLPERKAQRHEFELDIAFSYIPVYQHMVTPEPNEVPKPKTDPELVKERNKLFLQRKCVNKSDNEICKKGSKSHKK